MTKQFLIIAFCILINTTNAQINDVCFWGDVSVKKEMKKKYTISLSEGIRIQNNISTIKTIYSEIGLSYKIHKAIEVEMLYRLAHNNEINGYFTNHRVTFKAAAEVEYHKFKCTLINKTSYKKETYTTEPEDLLPLYENRNKLEILYNIWSFNTDPFVAIETFHAINKGTFYTITNSRYSIGFEQKLKHKFKLTAQYICLISHDNISKNSSCISLSIAKKL